MASSTITWQVEHAHTPRTLFERNIILLPQRSRFCPVFPITSFSSPSFKMYVTSHPQHLGRRSCPHRRGGAMEWPRLRKDRPASAWQRCFARIRKIFSIVAVAKFKHGRSGCYGQASRCDGACGERQTAFFDGVLLLLLFVHRKEEEPPSCCLRFIVYDRGVSYY